MSGRLRYGSNDDAVSLAVRLYCTVGLWRFAIQPAEPWQQFDSPKFLWLGRVNSGDRWGADLCRPAAPVLLVELGLFVAGAAQFCIDSQHCLPCGDAALRAVGGQCIDGFLALAGGAFAGPIDRSAVVSTEFVNAFGCGDSGVAGAALE